MKLLNERRALFIFSLLAITFISLAIIGGIRNYSPVPYWDMWDGYLNFYTKVTAGDVAAWWDQHNEHRILLARIFFWIDLKWFRGMVWFLIIVNYLLIAIACALFYVALKEQLSREAELFSQKILALLILTISFSWIQESNFTWGFQSQFILAQLLPLAAFFILHLAYKSQNHSSVLFVLACLTGVLSVGSMANGILALPIMALLALVLRMTWQQVFILCLLAVVTLAAYFYGYHSPGGHGSLTDALLNDPIGLIQYTLLYIGGPFYYMTNSTIIAVLAGLFLIASSAFFTWKFVRKASASSLQLAMLAFLLYIGGTALGTGGGRLIFGLEQAVSDRYQTPALMAWVALLILYSPVIAISIRNNTTRTTLLLMLVPLLLLPQQIRAIRSQQDTLFERWIASLALELGIRDQQQISSVYPNADRALIVAKEPIENNLAIFGHPLLRNVDSLIGQTVENYPVSQCQGHLDELSSVEGVEQYVRLRGWLFQPDAKKSPKTIHIMNVQNQIVGYALTGQPRPDVKLAISDKAAESGFKGYLLTQQTEYPLILRGYNPSCELKVNK